MTAISEWFRWMVFVFRHDMVWWRQPSPMFEFDTRIYVGRPGTGKTLFATRDAIRLMRRGYRVCANYSIRDPRYGYSAEVIRSWYDVLVIAAEACSRKEPTVFVIDEVNLWASSRFFKNTPGWWLALMAQRRHLGIGFICTAQRFNRVEIVLRELVNSIAFCSKFQIKRFRIFGCKVADPLDVEAAAAEGGGSRTAAAAARERLGFGWPVWMPGWVKAAYSTVEVIQTEEWADDEETDAHIKEVMASVATIQEVVYIPSVVDPYPVIEARLAICVECSEHDSCTGRFDAILGPVCERHEAFEGFAADVPDAPDRFAPLDPDGA